MAHLELMYQYHGLMRFIMNTVFSPNHFVIYIGVLNVCVINVFFNFFFVFFILLLPHYDLQPFFYHFL